MSRCQSRWRGHLISGLLDLIGVSGYASITMHRTVLRIQYSDCTMHLCIPSFKRGFSLELKRGFLCFFLTFPSTQVRPTPWEDGDFEREFVEGFFYFGNVSTVGESP